MVLAQGEAICSLKLIVQRGAPYTSVRDIGFSLTGPVNWAGRTAQVKVTANMVQEGCCASVEGVMEKIKARGPVHP